MRKIFIDGGSNIGQSIEAFVQREDSTDFDIYCFEASQSENVLNPLSTKINQCKEQSKSITFFNKAIWTDNGHITFYDQGNESSSITNRQHPDVKGIKIPCIDLSSWIKSNFNENDYIILKLDIEGAEYEVFDKLCKDGTINLVDKIYCEIHGIKCGKSLAQTMKMIKDVNHMKKQLYVWGNIDDYGTDKWHNKIYDEFLIKSEFHKWYMKTILTSPETKGEFFCGCSLYTLSNVLSYLLDSEKYELDFEDPATRKKFRFGIDPYQQAIYIDYYDGYERG